MPNGQDEINKSRHALLPLFVAHRQAQAPMRFSAHSVTQFAQVRGRKMQINKQTD